MSRVSEPHFDQLALVTDQYQLTMAQAYVRSGKTGEATFSLYFRTLPPHRNYILACGQSEILARLETLRFEREALDYLAGLGLFDDHFLRWLEEFRFTGSVRAVPEGTPVFPEEPILEVTAPLPTGQLLETLLLNQITVSSVLASKASRVVEAAKGRRVADFALRRMHGIDAALKGARAFHVAGVDATSHLEAGRRYGIPVIGTMAHSYVQSFDNEKDAFREFAALYPGTTLLVDTWDTMTGVARVIELARELGDAFDVAAIRLDSGDLGELARQARARFDEAGLTQVKIVASGGLDEFSIARLVNAEVPIDAFGTGTFMGVSRDAPSLDTVYKLVEYEGRGRMKTAVGKRSLPGPKQVWRQASDGEAVCDWLTLATEKPEAPVVPLLEAAVAGGKPVGRFAEPDLAADRAWCESERSRLPARIRALEAASESFEVRLGDRLAALTEEITERSQA